MLSVDSTPAFIESVYRKIESNLSLVRKRLGRPLTFAEKIIYGHLEQSGSESLIAGTSYIKTWPDRVALQDATAQMAILQFMLADKDSAAVPVTVHCDHLIRAQKGAIPDLQMAETENLEVYDFLASASKRYGFGCWMPGSGIIHQVVLEQYAFPGLMMLGTDSHTPNAGGLGCFACGVGGADAVDVMVGMPWEVLHPEIVGVKLTGQIDGWTAPKDVILKLLGIMTCAGGTNRVFEYFGPGAETISCTGKATICNMGAEMGATTSLFPYDKEMAAFLKAANRPEAAELAEKYQHLLGADQEVLENPEKYYAKVVEIDLSTLEPHVVGPHSPDRITTVSKMKDHVAEGGYINDISCTLIGSCTNSSYEDMGRIAAMAGQLLAKGVNLKSKLMISPGSNQIKATIDRDGQLTKLEKLGANFLTNACGPCIGQWQRDDIEPGEKNSILTSYNRNFPKRNDGNPETCCFIASPETCLAFAVFGHFGVDPFHQPIKAADGSEFTLTPPQEIAKTPPLGLVTDKSAFLAPEQDRQHIKVQVNSDSQRLQLLSPFKKWDGNDFKDLRLLLKAKGKCTTDHISPAGPWLRYRGHLNNISDNMFSGAVNSFSGEAGTGKNQLSGTTMKFCDIARAYTEAGANWVAVGDDNYGEGSSREHAAMSPRHMGALAIITRSFARIHETNLKKQGVLPLTFKNSEDYNLVQEDDVIDLTGVTEIAPGSEITCTLRHQDGSSSTIILKHSMNEEQILWFKAGSALNHLRNT